MADALTITRESCGPFWQVTAWPDTVGTVSAQLGDALGAAAPGPGGYIEAGGACIARSGPLVWWIIGDEPGVLAQMTPDTGTILDITDSRVRFTVSGARARDLMRRLAPLDFRNQGFPVGHIAATVAHHLSIHIARREATWDIYVTTTFADTLSEILDETAAQWVIG